MLRLCQKRLGETTISHNLNEISARFISQIYKRKSIGSNFFTKNVTIKSEEA